jgi:branched-chain amino acid transport system ATP-binding protein
VTFDGHDLLDLAKHRIAPMGIGRTFQNLDLFRSLTVRQNVLIGGHSQGRSSFISDALRWPGAVRGEKRLNARATELLDMLDLTSLSERTVSSLPFGTQKRVELARALATTPKLLLLDEPAAGLNHEEVDNLAALIVSLRDRFGTTILLVEHHMNLVMRVSDKVVVLNFGRTIAQGSPGAVRNDPEVVRAYLGSAT